MTKLTEQLNTVGIHNPHDFYAGEIFISYTPDGPSRSFTYAHWGVTERGVNLDPENYRAYGDKEFSLTFTRSKVERFQRTGKHPARKAAALLEAQDWAEKKFGKRSWARDPWGGYGDAAFVTARLAELKARAKARALAS